METTETKHTASETRNLSDRLLGRLDVARKRSVKFKQGNKNNLN